MRSCFGVLLSLIIVPVVVILVFTWVIFLSVNQPSFVKDALNQSNIYQKSYDLVAPSFSQMNSSAIDTLTLAEKSQALQDTISPDYLKQTTETTIDNFYAWVKGANPSFSSNLDLKSQKATLQNNLDAQLKQHYAALPLCTAANTTLSGEQTSQFPTCRTPSDQAHQSLYSTFDASAYSQGAINQIPDKISLNLPDSAKNVPSIYVTSVIFIGISTLVAILLFVFLILLFRHRPKVYLRWVGTLFMIISLPILAFIYITPSIINSEISGRLSDTISKSPVDIKNLVVNISTILTDRLYHDLTIVSLAILGLGFIIIIISAFIKNRQIAPEPVELEDEPPLPPRKAPMRF